MPAIDFSFLSDLSLTSHSQVRATRAIAATDEILITYGQHDAAELLRTYGISEGEHAQPAVTLDFRIDEVVDATRTSLAKAGAVLSAATATARCKEARNGRRPPLHASAHHGGAAPSPGTL